MQKNKLKKILSNLINIFLIIFIIVASVSMVIAVLSKKGGDDGVSIFGKKIFFVKSSSMEKNSLTDVSNFEIKDIPVKSAIFVEAIPTKKEEKDIWLSNLEVGDVLTFKFVYTKQEIITHRITNINKKTTGGYIIRLEGDNKNYDANVISQVIDTSKEDSPNYIIGKVKGVNYGLGVLIYALKSPVGLILIVIIPSLVIATLEIIRIVTIVKGDKKDREAIKSLEKDDEIKKLKEELERLKENNKMGT